MSGQSKRIAAESKRSEHVGARLRALSERCIHLLEGKDWMELTAEEKGLLSVMAAKLRVLADERKGTR